MSNFEYITKLIHDESGICIDETKQYLIESRLKPIARKNNLDNVDELISKIRTSNDRELIAEVIDAMTTNESLFFRDEKPFEQLRDIILPSFAGKHIKIWSAAASTGQEIYSTIITMEEKGFHNYEILGTDISPTVIERSKLGRYSQFEIQRGMPITLLLKYFSQDGDYWVVKDDYKKKASFKTYNLLDDLVPLGKFDVIFCRNVLIYFDADTKTKIYDKLAQVINPEGYLLLGTSESIMSYTDKFVAVEGATGLYKPA